MGHLVAAAEGLESSCSRPAHNARNIGCGVTGAPFLGDTVRDAFTGIEGILIAKTLWHDRSDEAAIQREGLNGEGEPFAVHWCPIMRIKPA
jgi:hypothetical protein